MNSGRGLDHEIATKVMGWKQVPHTSYYYPPGLLPAQNAFGHLIPNYSTDLHEAWKVLEKLESMGWTCKVGTNDCFCAKDWNGDWSANKPMKTAHGFGESAAHAICEAALVAVGL